MKPSFFSLFKRGRYLSTPHDGDDSDAARTLKEERERFAVATLAFCLRYDEVFRKHFWEKVCRVPDDPEQMPPIKADGVDIEPPEWADLSLTSDEGTDRYRWVIEAKAGASLKNKQNPAEPEFLENNHGYGALLVADPASRRTRLRYIVLGASDVLGIRDGQKRIGISVQERSWARLFQGLARKGIVKDLFDTFTELRIGEFYMEKAKAIGGIGGIQDAIKASTILNAFCDHLGVRGGKMELQFDTFEDGTGCFGYYVKQPRKTASPTYLNLQKATRTNGWCIAWFGYEHDRGGKTNRAVWFYLKTDRKQDSLRNKLSRRFSSESKRDGSEYCVRVLSPLEQSGRDFEWFKSVVDYAIKK